MVDSGPRGTWFDRGGRWLGRRFPERQILVRTGARISVVRLSKHTQWAMALVLAAAGAWAGYASVSYVLHDHVVAAKDKEIAGVRTAYRGLLSEVGEYQRKFAAITRDLEANHGMMLGLVEQNAALQQNLKSVRTELESSQQERSDLDAAREELKRQLAELEDGLHQAATRNYSLRGDLNSAEADLQTALSERNAAVIESRRLTRRVGELSAEMVELRDRERQAVERLSDHADGLIASAEGVIEKTGLEKEALFAAAGKPTSGQGGPFVPAGAADTQSELAADLAALEGRLTHWQNLRAVLEQMPLAAPLDSYYITSSYGKRRDPITRKWAMHYGLDLGARAKSPVLATAAGTVTQAGWKGRYGRFVEIDHGAGLKTRYGHMRKIFVKRGQAVNFRDKIGLLGNSGRSTGTHLHYEVVFAGKSRNPIHFIRAGRHVFQE